MARTLSSQLSRDGSLGAPLSMAGSVGAPSPMRRARSLRMSPIPALRKDIGDSTKGDAKQQLKQQLESPFAAAHAQRQPGAWRAAAGLKHAAVAVAALLAVVGCLAATGAGERLAPLLSPRIARSELPLARPPAWDYCSWGCARAVSLERRPNGALVAAVAHKPFAGVTAEMLRFWFDSNVDGDMVHPIDGKVYPRYMVWHPRDHLEQRTVAAGRPGDLKGAVWHINEFFLSSKPEGWVRADDPAEWARHLYTKVDLTVQKLDSAGLELGFALPGLGVKPVSLTHEWSDSPDGAVVVSTMYIGVPDGDGPAVRALNRVAQAIFACGGDAEAAARDWQLHALEEMGNFKFFLPQLYQSLTAGTAPPPS